jgi:hypothetical protein
MKGIGVVLVLVLVLVLVVSEGGGGDGVGAGWLARAGQGRVVEREGGKKEELAGGGAALTVAAAFPNVIILGGDVPLLPRLAPGASAPIPRSRASIRVR